ncbi:MAG: hypothetical protein Q4A43_01215 [Coriobacteriia bacterium]|nr:hypothetical protein [Coriobacteriia bacterium]
MPTTTLQGGGKALSDFTDVDWSTATLSLDKSEYTFDGAYESNGIQIDSLKDYYGNLNLYVGEGGSKELLSTSSYDFDYQFYTESEGGEAKDSVSESGIYYVKITLKGLTDGDGQPCIYYLPVKITIETADPYDLSDYVVRQPANELRLYVGDSILSSTSQVFESEDYSEAIRYCGEGDQLPSSAYAVDASWYKVVEDEDTGEYSYTKIDGVPSEAGDFGIRLSGASPYYGEIYLHFSVKAKRHTHTPVVSKAAVAPTYKTAGSTEEIKCSTCGIVLQAQSAVAKLSAKAQSVKVSTAIKSVKKAKVKKKAQTVSGAIKVSGGKGKVTYSKVSGSGKLNVNTSNGKVTVKKKTKKGTYSIKVRMNVAASADGQFKAFSKTVTVKVKVK